MIEVRRAGAKGLGVFAARPIPRGSRLLAEPPLLATTTAQPDVFVAALLLDSDKLSTLLQLSTNDSPRAQQNTLALSLWPTLRSILARPRTPSSLSQNRRVLNVFYNNNFALGDAAGTRALFPTVARLNHACVPGAQGNFNAALGAFTVHALRDIPAGDEVTISYLHDEMAAHDARQASLQAGYGFVCGCPICAGDAAGRAMSAVRRGTHKSVLRLYRLINAAGNTQRYEPLLLNMARLLISYYETEGLAGGRETASLYSLAAGHAVSLRDMTLAEELGRLALELERNAVGEDSPFFEAARLALEKMEFAPSSAKHPTVVEEDKEELSYAPWT
ncbi:[histone H3]-lysine4/36 N-trimethyltransferase SMYD [Microdochium nivale]|nr:[histone H3]-lysine4/36 N-trimethyltransferase SMYD [Microdochium nivale]